MTGEGSRSTTPFVVLFLGRSGSTYLMEALGQHPEIEAGFEELGSRRDLGGRGQVEFARGFLTGVEQPPVTATGFKTKLGDVLDPEGFATLLRDLGARVILLQRRNVVKAVVSWFRSELVNRETGDWNVYRTADRPPALTLDPGELLERLRAYERARERLQGFTLELERPTLMLYYEDLLAEAAATVAIACGFLGVAPLPLEGLAVKATPDDLRRAVTNFDELRAAAGNRYLHMFDEGAAVLSD